MSADIQALIAGINRTIPEISTSARPAKASKIDTLTCRSQVKGACGLQLATEIWDKIKGWASDWAQQLLAKIPAAEVEKLAAQTAVTAAQLAVKTAQSTYEGAEKAVRAAMLPTWLSTLHLHGFTVMRSRHFSDAGFI